MCIFLNIKHFKKFIKHYVLCVSFINMATAINNVSRRTSPSFARSMASSWIPHGIRSSMRVSSRASPEVVVVLHKSDEGENEREKERKKELSRGSPPRRAPLRLWRDLTRQWHGNSDAVQGQQATTKKHSQVVPPDGCAVNFFSLVHNSSLSPLPLAPALSPAMSFFFWPPRRRHMSPPQRRQRRKSIIYICETRALADVRSARWRVANGELSKECFCSGREGFIDSSFLCSRLFIRRFFPS